MNESSTIGTNQTNYYEFEKGRLTMVDNPHIQHTVADYPKSLFFEVFIFC